jgi:hypothetical protein
LLRQKFEFVILSAGDAGFAPPESKDLRLPVRGFNAIGPNELCSCYEIANANEC